MDDQEPIHARQSDRGSTCINLGEPLYQIPARLGTTLMHYVDMLKRFPGSYGGGLDVQNIASSVLQVAILPNGTPVQMQELQAVQAYGTAIGNQVQYNHTQMINERCVDIFSRAGALLISPMAELSDGLNVTDPEAIVHCIPGDAANSQIGQLARGAIERYRVVPNSVSMDLKGLTKLLLKAAGVRSWKRLMEPNTRKVLVVETRDGEFKMVPSRNAGRYFAYFSEPDSVTVTISRDSSDDELGAAIRDGLAACE